MSKSWKKLSRKIVLDHPRMTVAEDTVELPSGETTDYIHIVGGPDAACILPQRSDGKFLIQKEYSYPPDTWMYQAPGGGLESGETPEAGARRELAEEANLSGKLHKLGWFYTDNRKRRTKFHVFLGTDLVETSGQKDVEEDIIDFWFSEDEIDDMIQNGEIVNYSLLCAWSFYKARKKT